MALQDIRTVSCEINTALSLGGNSRSWAGGRRETLEAALKLLENKGFRIGARSRLYETEAVPSGAGPDFVNGVVLLDHDSTPGAVLQRLHEVEAEFGRTRTTRWGARPLDLDLLFVGAQILPDARTQTAWRCLPLERQRREAPSTLILPHPRLQDRAFVLVPLAEVAPRWRHPVLGLDVTEMRDRLPPSALAGMRAMD